MKEKETEIIEDDDSDLTEDDSDLLQEDEMQGIDDALDEDEDNEEEE